MPQAGFDPPIIMLVSVYLNLMHANDLSHHGWQNSLLLQYEILEKLVTYIISNQPLVLVILVLSHSSFLNKKLHKPILALLKFLKSSLWASSVPAPVLNELGP